MSRLLAACCVFLELVFTGCSFLNGGEDIVFCKTASGNNSLVNCTVPANSTELVLGCLGDDRHPPDWVKGNCTSPESSSSPLSCGGDAMQRNCSIERTLTNSDSGIYCCRETVGSGMMYHFINLNVNAPPEFNADSVGHRIQPLTSKSTSVQIVVHYKGNGPFTVLWKHNNTEYNCSEHSDVCVYTKDDPITKTSTLLLKNEQAGDAWKIVGRYTIVVTNPYGTNQTSIYVKYSCASENPMAYMVNNKILNLVKGRPFRETCTVQARERDISSTFVCLTRNTTYVLDDLIEKESTNCVFCDFDDSTLLCQPHILKGSIGTNMIFTRNESKDTREYCSVPKQKTSFGSDYALISYDGLTVICGYEDSDSFKQYAYFYLKVSEPSNLNRILKPSVSAGAGGFALAVIVTCVIVVGCCCKKRYMCHMAKRERRDNNVEASIEIENDVSSDEGEHLDEAAPLLPEDANAAECHEPIQGNSIGPGEVFPRELFGRNSASAKV